MTAVSAVMGGQEELGLICLQMSLVCPKAYTSQSKGPRIQGEAGGGKSTQKGRSPRRSSNANIWAVSPSNEGVTEAGDMGAHPAAWTATATWSRETCLPACSGVGRGTRGRGRGGLAGWSGSWDDGTPCWEVNKKERRQRIPQDADCVAAAVPLTLVLWAERTQGPWGPRSQGQSVGCRRCTAPSVHPPDYRLPASHFPVPARGPRPLSCLHCLLKDTVSH